MKMDIELVRTYVPFCFIDVKTKILTLLLMIDVCFDRSEVCKLS